jgi:Protein of unknown function (DUF3108)
MVAGGAGPAQYPPMLHCTIRPHRRACLAALLLFGGLAAPAVAEPLVARYAVRAAGLTVMTVLAEVELAAAYYRLRTEVRATGVAAILGDSHQVTSIEGAWRGSLPRPLRYRAEGVWRGAPRQVAIDWPTPEEPVISRLVPANEPEREAVPPALRRDTIDGLSAVVLLARAAAESGRCEGTAQVFDGRRRAEYQAVTEGRDRLAEPGFAGEALRCGIAMRVLAGRHAGQDPEPAKTPQHATAWLARLSADGPVLPVRIDLPSRWFGTIRIQLQGVQAGSGL